MIKAQYRIENWRGDIKIATIETLFFEGETLKACDDQAIMRMRQLSGRARYSWDGLCVSRIDSPAVAEKRTFLAKNGRQDSD